MDPKIRIAGHYSQNRNHTITPSPDEVALINAGGTIEVWQDGEDVYFAVSNPILPLQETEGRAMTRRKPNFLSAGPALEKAS